MDRPADRIPFEAMLRFTAAESRLYPSALTDPEAYQRVTALVGVVADELRAGCDDVAAVLARRSELVESVPALAAGAGLDAAGLPADSVVDAASAVRCRELGAVGPAAPGGA